MIAKGIKEIIALKRPETIEVNGKIYMRDDYVPAKTIYPKSLSINNLTGIVDYCKNVEGAFEEDQLFIHVEDYDKVFLYRSADGDFKQRPAIINAVARPCQYMFGQKIDIEQFIISMYGMFVPSADRDYLLKFVSNVKIDASARIDDDGTSQTVTAKHGVSSLVTESKVKNPVSLAPFRTFTDINQPMSEFVFRLGKNNDSPVCSLHECDGSAWKQVAIQAIKDFYTTELPDVPVIA